MLSHQIPTPIGFSHVNALTHKLPFQVTDECEHTHTPCTDSIFSHTHRLRPCVWLTHTLTQTHCTPLPSSLSHTGTGPDSLSLSHTHSLQLLSGTHLHFRPRPSLTNHHTTERGARHAHTPTTLCRRVCSVGCCGHPTPLWAPHATLGPAPPADAHSAPPRSPLARAPAPTPALPGALTRSQAPAPARTGSARSCNVGTTWWLRRELTGPDARDPGPAERRLLPPRAAGSGGLHPTGRPDHAPRDHLETPPVPASACRSRPKSEPQASRAEPFPRRAQPEAGPEECGPGGAG